MSPITTVGTNSKDESIVQFLLEKTPEIGATMIIGKEGKKLFCWATFKLYWWTKNSARSN